MSRVFVRRLRLGAAFVLLAYLILHFANHALGLVSLEAMGAGRWWFLALWRSAPGTLALYGAITAHGLLALWLLYDRRTLRMPPWEATQYAIGLLLPALLVVHVVSTRIAWWRFGVDDPYQRIVLGLSLQSPEFGARQTLTLVLAWLHACIGVHYWLRFRSWYPRALPWLFTVALLLPTLALLGFVAAGREVAALARTPGWTEAMLRSVHAPGPGDRRADRFEVSVQEEDDVVRQLVLGHPGEAAQIGEQDRQLLLAALAHVGAERFGRHHGRRQKGLDRHVAGGPRLASEPYVGGRADPRQHAPLGLPRRWQAFEPAHDAHPAGRAAASSAAHRRVGNAR